VSAARATRGWAIALLLQAGGGAALAVGETSTAASGATPAGANEARKEIKVEDAARAKADSSWDADKVQKKSATKAKAARAASASGRPGTTTGTAGVKPEDVPDKAE